VQECQTTFNSSFWELYLFAVLKRYGLSIDFSKKAPDFYVASHEFNIEAVIASNAKGAEPEYGRRDLERLKSRSINESNRQSILRLSNSLTGKHKKYLTDYAHLPHVKDRPFVIAVSHYDRPFSYLSGRRPIEAVVLGYYVDEDRYIAAGRPGGVLIGEDVYHRAKQQRQSRRAWVI
jgi:hypothetical protein